VLEYDTENHVNGIIATLRIQIY